MTENQKEMMISKLRAEKLEYEHFQYNLKDLQFTISALKEKIRQLNQEKELQEKEHETINGANNQEIATIKTEITLIKNEILIIEDDLVETKEKTGKLVQTNQEQDLLLDEMRENLREIQDEQIKIKEEKDGVDQEIEEFNEIRQKLFNEINEFNNKLEEINQNKKKFEEKLKEAKFLNATSKKKLNQNQDQQNQLNKEIRDTIDKIKFAELGLNEKENKIFKLETLKRTKGLENNHQEMELNSIKDRVKRYQVENDTLVLNIENSIAKIEEFEEKFKELREMITDELNFNPEIRKIRNGLNLDMEKFLDLSQELEKMHNELKAQLEDILEADVEILEKLDRKNKISEIFSLTEQEINKFDSLSSNHEK